MPTAQSFAKAVLSILICAVLVTVVSTAAASAQPPHASASVARSRCLGRSARTARRTRLCRAAAGRHRSAGRPRLRLRTTPPPATPAAQLSSAQSAAATIATVLATSCQNTELTPEADNIALVREAILCLINRKRAENGESPLVAVAQLEQAAEGHCQELIADDYFAHVSPSGETPVDRIRDTGYIPSPDDGYVIGENLAWGTYQLSTAQSIASAWFASPEHLANILEAKYRETGIGVIPAVPVEVGDGAPGATYAQEFGVIIP